MKPDWAREKVDELRCSIGSHWVDKEDAINLLRAERRRTLRMIKQQKLYQPHGVWGVGYNKALDELRRRLK